MIAIIRESGVDNRDVKSPPDKKPDTRRSAIMIFPKFLQKISQCSIFRLTLKFIQVFLGSLE